MDADARRMLADLGLARRDAVSAPEEITRGRVFRDDPREQAAAAAAFEKRRKHGTEGFGGADSRAEKLNAWNNEANFETDEVTARLENRWSGQGHRAKLNRQHAHACDTWETVDARYGEERRLYLQEKRKINDKHSASTLVTFGRDRFLNDTVKSNRSPFLNGGHSGRERATSPTPAPTRHRAPSPRQAGTVHFRKGARNSQKAIESPGVSNIALQVTLAMRAKAKQHSVSYNMAAIPPTPPPSIGPTAKSGPIASSVKCIDTDAIISQIVGRPAPKVEPAEPPKPKDEMSTTKASVSMTQANAHKGIISNIQAAIPSMSTGSSQTTQRAMFPSEANDPDAIINKIKARMSPLSTGSTQTINSGGTRLSPSQPNNPVKDAASPAACRNLALWAAANPGEMCDSYHAQHPNRLRYLGPARDQLIKEATGLVERQDNIEISRYLECHSERAWLVDAARKAKTQVEEDSDADIQHYCANHPRQKLFVLAAVVTFAPERETRITQLLMDATPSAPPVGATTKKSAAEAGRASSSVTSGDGGGENSTESEEIAETAASSPPRSGIGSLVATFLGVTGEVLSSRRYFVNAPVQAKIDIRSRKSNFNPRQLINSIEALAQSMVDRSQGLEGVMLTEDGLWVDTED